MSMTNQEVSDQRLRDVQLVLVKVLEELDRVCRALDIQYAVYGGTAIGAVRHGGFIPWDDDIDVLMLRPDYERFLAQAPAIMSPEFRLDNTRTNPEFPFMFTKMVLKGTLLIPESAKDTKYRMPVFVDILPLDPLPDDPKEQKKQIRQTWLWGRLLFLQGTGKPHLGVRVPARTAIYAATGLAHKALNLARKEPRVLQERWEKAARKFEGTVTERVADFTMRDPLPWAVTTDELFPAVDVPFEHITVRLPREFDKVLSRGYGDYMTMPPPEQRIGHLPHEIDLGPYEPERGVSPDADLSQRYGADGYDPDTSGKLHALLLDVLKEFDRVCKELDLPYAVYAGTAIGAVRHKGFIPWDDDVDVMMLRDDYERFLREAPALLGPQFQVDSIESDPDYPNTFANLSLVGTQFISEAAKDRPYRMPIGLDIFPLDKVASGKIGSTRQKLETAVLGRLLFLHGNARPYVAVPAPAKQIVLGVTTFVHNSMKVLGVSSRKLQKRWRRAATRHRGSKNALYADFSTSDPMRWSMTKDELFPAAEGEFEGVSVSLPRKYEQVLTRGYGDFMRIPEPQDRVNHRPHLIDWGPYTTEDLR